MEVLTCVDDYCVLKLVLTSALADVPIAINKTMTHDALKALHPAAKSVLMKTAGDYLTQHVPMMRMVASASKKHAQLAGEDEVNKSQVDQWLEYSWQELGWYIILLIVLTVFVCARVFLSLTFFVRFCVYMRVLSSYRGTCASSPITDQQWSIHVLRSQCGRERSVRGQST